MTNLSVGTYLQKITQDDELIIITDEDWDSSTLYAANRRGFMIRGTGEGLLEMVEEHLKDGSLQQMFESDNYTTLETHQLTVANAFLIFKSNLIQYPLLIDGPVRNARDIFVYKFADTTGSSQEYHHEMLIDNCSTYPFEGIVKDAKILMEYQAEESTAIDAILTDENNQKYLVQLSLLKDANKISLDFSGICKNLASIQLDLKDNQSVRLNY